MSQRSQWRTELGTAAKECRESLEYRQRRLNSDGEASLCRVVQANQER
jgi:hypothetical protein